MNIKTITIQKTIKRFAALTPKQKDKVIEKLSDINVMHDWYEYTYEDYVDKLEKLGFTDIEFSWSGFWSQGDCCNDPFKNMFCK